MTTLGEKKLVRKEFANSLYLSNTLLKPVLKWANVCSPEHSSGCSSNYTSFLN